MGGEYWADFSDFGGISPFFGGVVSKCDYLLRSPFVLWQERLCRNAFLSYSLPPSGYSLYLRGRV